MFFQVSRNRSDAKFSYQILPWISCKVTYRFRNVNVGGSFSLTNKSNVILVLYKSKDIHKGKVQSNKTPALAKSTNMGVWAVVTLNQLFTSGS